MLSITSKEKGLMVTIDKQKRQGLISVQIICMFCFLVLVVSGCSTSGMKHFTRPGADVSSVSKVAVLPFDNHTSDMYAGEKVRSIVIIELLSRGMEVVEPGEVNRALIKLKIRSLARASREDYKSIAEELEIDGMITGSVETYGISRGISVSYPEVSIGLSLIGSGNGSVLWSTWHTGGGADFWTRHFGVEGRTLDQASRDVVGEAFEPLFSQVKTGTMLLIDDSK